LQDGCTALFLASENGHLDVVQYLIDKCGANGKVGLFLSSLSLALSLSVSN
jgi:hypothetical protein